MNFLNPKRMGRKNLFRPSWAEIQKVYVLAILVFCVLWQLKSDFGPSQIGLRTVSEPRNVFQTQLRNFLCLEVCLFSLFLGPKCTPGVGDLSQISKTLEKYKEEILIDFENMCKQRCNFGPIFWAEICNHDSSQYHFGPLYKPETTHYPYFTVEFTWAEVNIPQQALKPIRFMEVQKITTKITFCTVVKNDFGPSQIGLKMSVNCRK